MERNQSIISAIVILAVNIAAMVGFNIDADALQQVIMAACLIAATVWGIWTNHNFTDAAMKAQHYLNYLKSGGGDDDADC